MNTKRILGYLHELSAHNNRDWFHEHKAEYDICRQNFEEGVAQAVATIAQFDASISHITPKDACYRFNRDTRFSEDKRPYKEHFGAYICARGKKALRGGYYLHLEPGNCLVAVGGYWLPTNILTSCRNEIMSNIEEWRRRVENASFIKLFGRPGEGKWENSTKGFGLELLKTAPSGFPRDYEFIQYLRMKDYCSWTRVSDTFFEGDCWLDGIVKTFQVAKPMMDFINAVVDDYE